jgi:hypothetical protein
VAVQVEPRIDLTLAAADAALAGQVFVRTGLARSLPRRWRNRGREVGARRRSRRRRIIFRLKLSPRRRTHGSCNPAPQSALFRRQAA